MKWSEAIFLSSCRNEHLAQLGSGAYIFNPQSFRDLHYLLFSSVLYGDHILIIIILFPLLFINILLTLEHTSDKGMRF